MATQVKHRRGTQSEIDAFTGAIGEIVVNTTEEELVLNNGATQGGIPIAKKRNTLLSFDTLADAVANTAMKVGYSVNLKERSTGNGGGAQWDVVLASSVTPNTFDIVQCTGVPTLALVLRKDVVITPEMVGAVSGAVSSNALQRFLDLGDVVKLEVLVNTSHITNQQLSITNNDTKLIINGKLSIGDGIDLHTSDADSSVIKVDGATNVEITGNGTINCNFLNGSQVGWGINVDSGSNGCKITDISVISPFRGHIRFNESDDCLSINVTCTRDVATTTTGRESITFINSLRAKAIGNTVKNGDDACIAVHPNCDGFVIQGNVIDNRLLIGPCIDIVGKLNGGVCSGNTVRVLSSVNQPSGGVAIRANVEASALPINQEEAEDFILTDNTITVEDGAVIQYGIRTQGAVNVDITNNKIVAKGSATVSVGIRTDDSSINGTQVTDEIYVERNTIKGVDTAISLGGTGTISTIHQNKIVNCDTGIGTAYFDSIGQNEFFNVTTLIVAGQSSLNRFKKKYLKRVVFKLEDRTADGLMSLVGGLNNWYAEHDLYVVGFRGMIDQAPSGGNLNFLMKRNGSDVTGASIQFQDGVSDLHKIDTGFSAGMELYSQDDYLSFNTTQSAALGTIDCYVEAFYFEVN